LTIETFIGLLVIAGVGWYTTHKLTSLRDLRAKRGAARTDFLAAVTDDALSAPTLAIYVHQNLTVNIHAIDTFRRFVPTKDQAAYDQAAKEYYDACEPHRNLGLLASLAVDLSPNAVSDRQAIIEAIKKLRTFAN